MRVFFAIFLLCSFITASANAEDLPPLSDHYKRMAMQGKVTEISRALDKGLINVNSVNYKKETMLHWAVGAQHPALVAFLIEQGADIHAKDVEGRDPFFWATVSGTLREARTLLDAGAKPDTVDSLEKTPYLRAVEHQRHEVVDFLKDITPDVASLKQEKKKRH